MSKILSIISSPNFVGTTYWHVIREWKTETGEIGLYLPLNDDGTEGSMIWSFVIEGEGDEVSKRDWWVDYKANIYAALSKLNIIAKFANASLETSDNRKYYHPKNPNVYL